MKKGTCTLCSKPSRIITKDHIQPQNAFNEKKRRFLRLASVHDFYGNEKNGFDEKELGSKFLNIYQEIQPDDPIEGGIYRFTQCKKCNNLLGNAYDSDFGSFCRSVVRAIRPGQIISVNKEYAIVCRSPLSVLKRIIAMFFSINGVGFAKNHLELSTFVQERRALTLPNKYQIYIGVQISDFVSHIPFQCRLDLRTNKKTFLSQITHPPLVYVMTVDSNLEDSPLTNVNSFSNIPYHSEGSEMKTFRAVQARSCFASDFRPSGRVIDSNVMVTESDLPSQFFKIVDSII